jgi:hypothetical protein
MASEKMIGARWRMAGRAVESAYSIAKWREKILSRRKWNG